ncbi:hypothetical protein L202_01386 [Cryptococcus amylolentus CBS 6039]|uniref:Bromo domain-containing protein n=1 Tax=Cryptococcus amylolentus CBS 6039 TaxID=1295533 RepID=A0A1E3I3U8_9TREE|nr:hypothetical protein L202_01386 [Cryptococcus amylolentus CBS 6039]ODN83198.1 hypothetical protein L202_01386 [Cryptococcus amylolentus CBS 6039]
MDLSTILRNAKARKYKNKAEFAADLDLIWKNCHEYNSQETHPLRSAAKFMKQKADHHLEYLADRAERTKHLQTLLPSSSASTPAGPSGSLGVNGAAGSSRLREGSTMGGDEDAAGESDDALGEGDDADGEVDASITDGEAKEAAGFREGGAERGERGEAPGRGEDGQSRGVSVASSSRAGQVNGLKRSPSAKRPLLPTTLDSVPALLRTPQSIASFSPVFPVAEPSWSDKGKAKEIISPYSPPSWYASFAGPSTSTSGSPSAMEVDAEDQDAQFEGCWWGALASDEVLVAGLPAVPTMATPRPVRRKRLKPSLPVPPLPNGIANHSAEQMPSPHSPQKPHIPPRSRSPSPSPGKLPATEAQDQSSLQRPSTESAAPSDKPISIPAIVRRTINNLDSARSIAHRVSEFQRIEAEGGVLPPRSLSPPLSEQTSFEEARQSRREALARERQAILDRRREGGEVGREEAVLTMRMCTAGLLARAGFEGANEGALDLFTRVAADHLERLGRTFRLLMDGLSHKMSPEELILHALHENGQVETRDIESHIKDDIQREDFKVNEMHKKMRHAFFDITSAPVIEDDQMFADDGEMLLDGNFAEELGEDFLGLRELGIAGENGMSTLSVPQSLFYGRKKRPTDHERGGNGKSDLPYPPPPPFVSLSPITISTTVPALLHAFYSARVESGLSLSEDDAFDAARAQIGSLGQVLIKGGKDAKFGNTDAKGKGKKRDRDEDEDGERKKSSAKKEPGVGKGNWTRPSKTEKTIKIHVPALPQVNGSKYIADDEEEDAEGEEE